MKKRLTFYFCVCCCRSYVLFVGPFSFVRRLYRLLLTFYQFSRSAVSTVVLVFCFHLSSFVLSWFAVLTFLVLSWFAVFAFVVFPWCAFLAFVG